MEEKLDVHIGVITVVTHRGIEHILLEIFGSDVKEVRDHILAMAEYLGHYCFEPED